MGVGGVGGGGGGGGVGGKRKRFPPKAKKESGAITEKRTAPDGK